jgi:hypothetical protein
MASYAPDSIRARVKRVRTLSYVFFIYHFLQHLQESFWFCHAELSYDARCKAVSTDYMYTQVELRHNSTTTVPACCSVSLNELCFANSPKNFLQLGSHIPTFLLSVRRHLHIWPAFVSQSEESHIVQYDHTAF